VLQLMLQQRDYLLVRLQLLVHGRL
jgi:hypothetical protein